MPPASPQRSPNSSEPAPLWLSPLASSAPPSPNTPSTPREAGNPNAAQCCLRSRPGGVERVVEQVARLTYQELLQSRQQPAARSSSCDPSSATLVRTHTWRMRPRESQVAGNG